MRHHLCRMAAALAVGLAVACLPSSPASANEVDVEISGGDLSIYDENGDLFATVALAGGNECGPTVKKVNLTGGAVFATGSISTSTDKAETIGGTHYRVWRTFSLSGTFIKIGPGVIPVSVTGSYTSVKVRTTGPGSCTPINGAGACTLDAGNLALAGNASIAGTMPTLAAGDSVELAGGNSFGDDTVSGTATNCGAVIAANNGYSEITDLVLEVV